MRNGTADWGRGCRKTSQLGGSHWHPSPRTNPSVPLTEIPVYTAVFLPKRVRNHCQIGMVNVAESCRWKNGEGWELEPWNPSCPSQDPKGAPRPA